MLSLTDGGVDQIGPGVEWLVGFWMAQKIATLEFFYALGLT